MREWTRERRRRSAEAQMGKIAEAQMGKIAEEPSCKVAEALMCGQTESRFKSVVKGSCVSRRSRG